MTKRALSTYDEQLTGKTRIYTTTEEDKTLKTLISEYKTQNPKIGNITNVNHEIQLSGKFEASKCEYGVPIALQPNVIKHMEELEKDGDIREIDTPYVSPAFFIRKSNGKLRLIVDYRNLNKVTVKAHNYRPKIMDILNKLKGCKYFSKIDLNQGFYQINIKDEDISKTGFRVLGKTYVFKRMPFGLTNAPFTFQSALSKIICDILNVYFYIDDILIASNTFETHVNDIKTVL
ncbi:Retrovirus-related Pol polyprotein from transposon [Dictyocoela muelleri]|nr:Retrovirus-related Pol polyprotein from transposon [Dictyocoela muelleri]